MKVQIIANACFCSTTSVQRFIYKLGFDSFSDFKIQAKHEVEFQNTNLQFIELQETLTQINISTIDALVSAICKSNMIYVYATGASIMTATFLVRQLMLLGIPAKLIDDIHILKNIKVGLFIAVSNSGSTRLLINSVLRARNNGLTIAAITRQNSVLDNMAHVSSTHRVLVRKMDYIEREMQIHLLLMISHLMFKLRD